MFSGRGLQSGSIVPSRKRRASSSTLSSQWTPMFALLFMVSLILLMLLALRILSVPADNTTMGEKEKEMEANVEEEEDEDEEEEEVVISPRVEILSWEPRLFRYHDFLTQEECEHLIQIGKPRLKTSTTRGPSNIVDPNSGAHIKRGEDEIVKRIEQRIADFSFVPVEYGEGLKVLRQDPGLEYGIHFDYLEDEASGKDGRQKLATFLVYLSEVEEGGETVFPIAVPHNSSALPREDELSECAREKGVAVKPKMGDALLWWNLLPDSQPDTFSIHGGCPAIKGVKWTSTKGMHAEEWRDSAIPI